MDRKHNNKIVPFAKELRKNMTKEERHLWYDFLKSYPINLTRQKVLDKYIADCYCAKANIVIELDGSQHYEDDGLINDEMRTAYLEQYGITVIRILNLDVLKNFEGVCMYIDNEVKQSLSQLRCQLPLHNGAFRGAFERSTVMNFTTWFVIAIAIIVPVASFIFHNKE